MKFNLRLWFAKEPKFDFEESSHAAWPAFVKFMDSRAIRLDVVHTETLWKTFKAGWEEGLYGDTV